MKKSILILCGIAALAVTGLTSCTINKPQEVTRKITVNGSGTVNVDQAVLSFTVRTRDIDSAVANKTNSELSSVVVDAAKAAGVEAKDIASVSKSETEKGTKVWIKDESGEWVGKEDYTVVSNKINITINDVTRTKSVKDVIVQKAGNSAVLSNVSYITGDTASSLRQARTNAVQTAQDAANLLAGASGCKVNKVLEINEEKTKFAKINAKSLVSETLAGAVSPVSDGVSSVTADVTITYQLMD